MLKTKKIQKLREHIIKELKYARRIGVNVITINIEPELLEKAIFEEKKDEKGNVYKKFAIENSLIQELDFTGISFENFNAIGQNLEKFYGIEIDPQKLYKKSLFDTKLRNAEIKSDSEDAFKDVNLEYASLKNCKGAVLNPQTIKNGSLAHTHLENIKIESYEEDQFKDIVMHHATIKNCEGAVLNPQTIYEKSLYGATIEGIGIVENKDTLNQLENVDSRNLKINAYFVGKERAIVRKR